MLQGYFDDSGSDGQRPPFVLGGYILPADNWAAFSDDWKAECSRPPTIDYFKMFQACDASGEFDLWQYDIRRHKILKLIEVMRKHKLHGLCSYFRWHEWRAFAKRLRGPAKTQPYSVLFFLIIDIVKEYQKDLGIFPQKSQLDFDEQGKSGQFAIEWYGRMCDASQPFYFSEEHLQILEGTPRMLNDKNYLPLQASDMLAWAMRRHLDDPPADPGILAPDFSWVYEELKPDLWAGVGFNQASWDEIRRQVGI